MNKYVFFTVTLLGIIFGIKQVAAHLPMYGDDDEFKRCTKVSTNWNKCTHEETLRTLDAVKREYREILGNPIILGWHPQPEENTQMLRDMYESWTAFRNRLCLLSYQASKRFKQRIDERYSCNLYYMLHHHAHLNSILQLMQNKVPDKREDFHFLDIAEHDDEYQTCLGKETENVCLNKELARSSKAVKEMYKKFIEDKFVGKWNNGPSLQQGNYRDMYDSWIAYRNRFCSLATWAYKHAYGDKAPAIEQCLLMLNKEKTETMKNLMTVAHDALHKLPPQSNGIVTNPEGDGGEEVGKSITPLEKRIDAGDSVTDDTLVVTYPKQKAPVQTQQRPSNVNIPAWARQK